VRPTTIFFNRLSGKLGLEMCKYFKASILTPSDSHKHRQSCSDEILKVYQNIRRNTIGAKIYTYIKPEEKTFAEGKAKVHASILMAGIAYNMLAIPSDKELEEETWQQPLFEKVEHIEKELFDPLSKEEQKKTEEPKQQSSRCKLF
jgi:hypothetical protein